MTTTVWLLPHTHWDREWYEPFQRFRLRLVDLMDDVVARAQREPDFRFTMDGQMAAVDDYLEVRPEQADAVRALVARGQLAIGPWRVLMDEFLCSGETMIRNLEMGWADASRLGPVMPIGYLPDMFGHCAQMPQILAHVGIEQAVVYRGVPAHVERHEFLWRSPDGTGVRTEFLANSYGNAADVFGAGAARQRLAERLAAQSGPYAADFLAMYGTDHAAPLPSLMAEVADLNTDPAGPRVQVATLTEYLAAPRTPERELLVVDGELRSHARANLLPGVLSVRWRLKEAMARAERMLVRYAEPFAALLLPTLPTYYLDLAWRGVIDSSCHDSVTGCGVDETAVQVLARLEQAEHAAQAVRDRALSLVTAAAPVGSLVVANPLGTERVDLLDVTVPVPDQWEAVALALPDSSEVAALELSRPPRELSRERVPAGDLPRLMHRVHDRELFGLEVRTLEIDELGRRVTFHVADRGDPSFDAIGAGLRLRAAAEGDRDGASDPGSDRPTTDAGWEVITLDEPRRRLAATVPVPALGWTTVRPVAAEVRSESSGAPDRPPPPPDGRTLDNGLLSVVVADDGTLTLTAGGVTTAGVGRLVDGGDCGDTYNYGPPDRDAIIDTPTSVTVTASDTTLAAGSSGYVVSRMRIVRCYDLPTTSDRRGRAATTEATRVTTDVELRAGEPFVRLRVEWENRSSDHRLRLHLPTPRPAAFSDAKGQLAVVRRGRTAEAAGRVGEHPLATFPAEQFVDAGGLAVLLGRTTEYEVCDTASGGTELALTLLRAVGHLSRNVHPYRSEPAGPQLATPAAQVLGPGRMTLAVLPHGGTWAADGVGAAAEAFLHPVVVSRGTGPADAATTAVEGLRVGGEGVDLLSVRRRRDDDTAVEVRLVNASDEPTTAVVGSPSRPVRQAFSVNGRGESLGRLPVRDGLLSMTLGPWQLAAVQCELEAPITP